MSKIKLQNASETKTSRKPIVQIEKSRRLTSIEEFVITNNLRPEAEAGFKAWLSGAFYHTDEEWDKLYRDYTNRKLNGGE